MGETIVSLRSICEREEACAFRPALPDLGVGAGLDSGTAEGVERIPIMLLLPPTPLEGVLGAWTGPPPCNASRVFSLYAPLEFSGASRFGVPTCARAVWGRMSPAPDSALAKARAL